MEERRVADYFVVAGLPEEMEPFDEFAKDVTGLRTANHPQAPITDLAVIFPSLGETVPDGFQVIHSTPTGILADLNHGSLRSPEVFLCFRRGRDKPPLVDVGVMYDGKERILADSEVVEFSPSGKPANVNNSAAKTLVTFRRAPPSMACNSLVVTDIVVIITSKGETPPHAFCMIKKNLNKGLVGSDVYICYKKSMNRANLITYKPGILLRYPVRDQARLPLPASVPLFCLPMGCTLERWPADAQQPQTIFSTFVLTVSDAAEKLYGSAVMFYEPYPEERLTAEQRAALSPAPDEPPAASTYNINKCICLLSRWPFFDTFERFLLFIHGMAVSRKPCPVPIEKYISFLLEDVPFPSPQRPRILVQLSATERLILTQPEDLPLPRSGAGFRQLLMNLGPDNCLLLLVCALTEQKMLVHSLRPDVLTAVAEAISMIVFPFKWQCPYIPLCPLGLAEVLNAPLPYLIGVDSRFFDLYHPPTDVNCVDLDTNSITLCEEKRHLHIKLLPKKAGRALRATLERLYRTLELLVHQTSEVNGDLSQPAESSIDKDFQMKRKEQGLELEIQEAFLRFMAQVLKGYRAFLLPITKAPTIGTTDTQSLFDLNGFLRSRDKTFLKFYTLLTKTQMFIRFIEERSFVSDMDASLAFFDEVSEKVEKAEKAEWAEEEGGRLVEVEDWQRSERTMLVMAPEPGAGAPSSLYPAGFQLDLGLLGAEENGGAHHHHHPAPHQPGGGGQAGGGGGSCGSRPPPGSPMARRTKHEMKLAQRMARAHSATPHLWAKHLVATCYSVWFIHLPAHVLVAQKRAPATLRYAYDLLVKVHKYHVTPIDEVCYRVMMQLCGVYNQPVVAVKLLFHMKRAGVQPNAITYGFYNRAVLEASWPSGMSNSSQLLWNKLRNVIIGAAHFRRAGQAAAKRRISASNEDSVHLESGIDLGSRTSIESVESSSLHKGTGEGSDEGLRLTEPSQEPDLLPDPDAPLHPLHPLSESGRLGLGGLAALDRFRSRVNSIVRPTGLPLAASYKGQPWDRSAAGLLMTGREEDESPAARRPRSGSCSEFQGLGPQVAQVHTPTRPQPPLPRVLSRSESFAHDAGILAKLTPPHPPPPIPEHPHPRRASLPPAPLSGVGGVLAEASWLKSTDIGSRESLKSPVKSPSRTPLTEGDPLGALEEPAAEPVAPVEAALLEPDQPSRAPSEIELDHSGAPVLFERRTGGEWPPDPESDEEPAAPSPAPTTPAAPRTPAAAAQHPSSFKIPFGRYSPGRFSLRKAADIRITTHLIENAINNLSPSSLSGKKSNELIMGGLSTLKSAANTMVKKFDEIKEAISANSTPIKAGSLRRGTLERDSTLSYYEDELEYGEEGGLGRRKVSSEYGPGPGAGLGHHSESWGSALLSDMFGDYSGSRKGSTSNLGDPGLGPGHNSSLPCIVFPKGRAGLGPGRPPAMELALTTATRCHHCAAVLYDEHIMAGWVPEDSNLNTKCPFCEKATVPLLTVTVTDFRERPMPPVPPADTARQRKLSSISLGASRNSLGGGSEGVEGGGVSGSGGGVAGGEGRVSEPLAVPYLNPLVLRKELEWILAAEGDLCLTQPKFVDQHPIIYWNMVWMFSRICVDSHLPGLALGAACGLADPHPSWAAADAANVLVSPHWHNPRLHEEVGQPMYTFWNQESEPSPLVSALVTDNTTVPRSVMEKVISYLQCGDIGEPIKFLAKERQKMKGRGHSLYREILFLAITALGRDNIDQGAFDREYMLAFHKLPEKEADVYLRCDAPLTLTAIYCRNFFKPLQL